MQYSFLGMNPAMVCRINIVPVISMKCVILPYQLCLLHPCNPKHYTGFGPDCWGLTASYSVNGYAAHASNEKEDLGVISPTAALSSIVYTPEYSCR